MAVTHPTFLNRNLALGRLAGLGFQALQLVLLARVLGSDRFSELTLLTAITGIVTAAGFAWSSAFQNALIDEAGQASRDTTLSAAALLTCATSALAFLVLLCVAHANPRMLPSLQVLFALDAVPATFLLVSTALSSLTMLQSASLAAEGCTARLAAQEALSRALGLIFVAGCHFAKLELSAPQALSAIQGLTALPAAGYCLAHWRTPRRTTVASFARGLRGSTFTFLCINCVAASLRALEANIVNVLTGSTGTAAYGLAQRFFSPLASVSLSSTRHFWRLHRHAGAFNPASQRPAQIWGAVWVTLVAVGVVVSEPAIHHILGAGYTVHVWTVALVACQTYSTLASSLSFTAYAALGRQVHSLWALLVQMATTLSVWLLTATGAQPASHTLLLLFLPYGALAVAVLWQDRRFASPNQSVRVLGQPS